MFLVLEKAMKSILNKACMSALLCGAILVGAPAFAAGVGVGGGVAAPGATGANAGIGAGMTSPGTINSGIGTATAGNNVGSLDTTTQTPASQMSQKAQANANAAEARQLNGSPAA